MKLVVTGCGGFIGSHFLDRMLTRDDVEIIGWDPDDGRIRAHLSNPRFTLRARRLDGPDAHADLAKDTEACDWIINLAAICNPSLYNTQALRTIHVNLFEAYPVVKLAAQQGRKLMHFSTSEVYGRTLASYMGGRDEGARDLTYLDAETTPLVMGPIQNQRWSYATSKQVLERLIYAHHVEQGLQFAIVRPFNFFGPRMDYLPGIEAEGLPRVLPVFLSAMLRGQPMQLVDGGHARRTITSIHDAVAAMVAIIDQPDRSLNHVYNIGNPANEVSMRELAQALRRSFVRVTGETRFATHPIEDVPALEFYGKGYEDCDRRIMDISRESARLGWVPKVDLDSLLDEVVAWYWGLYGQPASRAQDPAPQV
jgi:UDP-apiose/xylose synthase